jgi:hypothetical protein
LFTLLAAIEQAPGRLQAGWDYSFPAIPKVAMCVTPCGMIKIYEQIQQL